MKKLIVLAIGTLVLNGGTMTVIASGKVYSEKMSKMGMTLSAVKAKPEYKKVRIKDGGVERIIHVEIIKQKNSIQQGNTSPLEKKETKLDKLTSKVGLIMKFNKKIEIDDFSARFGLKLKIKLESIDYYIFENKSEFTDIELINQILKTDIKEDISTIRANWPMDVELN